MKEHLITLKKIELIQKIINAKFSKEELKQVTDKAESLANKIK